MSANIEILKAEYANCMNEYVRIFCKKQGFDLKDFHWAADIVGDIACIADYSFNMPVIVYDINSKQKKGLILKWQDEAVESAFTNQIIPSYYEYCQNEAEEKLIQEAKKKAKNDKHADDIIY